jgi:mRNA interferase MazF
MKPKQYEIILVNLDPTIGSEIKKTRPCAIISPDDINRQLNTVIIAPITSTSKSYPTRIYTKSLSIPGWIVLDQIRTIDQSRILKKLGQLNSEEVQECKAIIEEMLVK